MRINENTQPIQFGYFCRFKSDEIDKVRYYTVLIISCKKSKANNWGFLTKELYKKDPNFNHYPISDWTNDDHLKFMLKKEKPKDIIVEQFDKNITLKAIYGLKKQVLAFHEIFKVLRGFG